MIRLRQMPTGCAFSVGISEGRWRADVSVQRCLQRRRNGGVAVKQVLPVQRDTTTMALLGEFQSGRVDGQRVATVGNLKFAAQGFVERGHVCNSEAPGVAVWETLADRCEAQVCGGTHTCIAKKSHPLGAGRCIIGLRPEKAAMSFDLLPLPAAGLASAQIPPLGDPEHQPPGPARPGSPDPIRPEPLGPTPPNQPPLDPPPEPGQSVPRALRSRRHRGSFRYR